LKTKRSWRCPTPYLGENIGNLPEAVAHDDIVAARSDNAGGGINVMAAAGLEQAVRASGNQGEGGGAGGALL
jgi:hypothetical protein